MTDLYSILAWDRQSNHYKDSLATSTRPVASSITLEDFEARSLTATASQPLASLEWLEASHKRLSQEIEQEKLDARKMHGLSEHDIGKKYAKAQATLNKSCARFAVAAIDNMVETLSHPLTLLPVRDIKTMQQEMPRLLYWASCSLSGAESARMSRTVKTVCQTALSRAAPKTNAKNAAKTDHLRAALDPGPGAPSLLTLKMKSAALN